jgi:4'-phosphopantetheinyl transferase
VPVRGIDVWVRLTEHMKASDLERDRALLDTVELERRDRLLFYPDRRDYAAAHAVLRRMLCARYGADPATWRFEATPTGKPRITGPRSDELIDFSLSHARGAVACAVADAVDIGIDVERIDRSSEVEELAHRFFSQQEARRVTAAAPPLRRERFIELWTLKEAYVKALGTGLSSPLDSFAFAFGPGAILRLDASAGPADAWAFALYAVGTDASYRHALAVRPHAPAGAPRIDICDPDDSGAAVRLIRATPSRQAHAPR